MDYSIAENFKGRNLQFGPEQVFHRENFCQLEVLSCMCNLLTYSLQSACKVMEKRLAVTRWYRHLFRVIYHMYKDISNTTIEQILPFQWEQAICYPYAVYS